MGHARVFDTGVGGWTNEQTRGKMVDSARLVLLCVPSGAGGQLLYSRLLRQYTQGHCQWRDFELTPS